MKTSVVILNWNTKDYLERFLPGIVQSCKAQGDAEVVVADSGSTDGSMELVQKNFPDVRWLPLGSNFGFTGGYNRALNGLDADYYILMNSDIEVPQGWLAPLVEWMDSHPECGACGPKLLSYYDHGSFEYAGAAGGFIDRYGYPFCRGRVLGKVEKDEGQYDAPAQVMWASGACLMVRRKVWEELGGLDDRFFAHMEEIDFCWRLQRAGYEVWVVPQSEVYHLGGGTLPKESPWKLELNYRNNLLMLRKNLPDTLKARWTVWFRYLLDIGSACIYLITGKKELASAVARAHKGYRKLRSEAPSFNGTDIPGHTAVRLLPAVALKKNIFTYLRRYEDCYRRSR